MLTVSVCTTLVRSDRFPEVGIDMEVNGKIPLETGSFMIVSVACHLRGSFTKTIGFFPTNFPVVSDGIRGRRRWKNSVESQSEYCVHEMPGKTRIRAILSRILGPGLVLNNFDPTNVANQSTIANQYNFDLNTYFPLCSMTTKDSSKSIITYLISRHATLSFFVTIRSIFSRTSGMSFASFSGFFNSSIWSYLPL